MEKQRRATPHQSILDLQKTMTAIEPQQQRRKRQDMEQSHSKQDIKQSFYIERNNERIANADTQEQAMKEYERIIREVAQSSRETMVAIKLIGGGGKPLRIATFQTERGGKS